MPDKVNHSHKIRCFACVHFVICNGNYDVICDKEKNKQIVTADTVQKCKNKKWRMLK